MRCMCLNVVVRKLYPCRQMHDDVRTLTPRQVVLAALHAWFIRAVRPEVRVKVLGRTLGQKRLLDKKVWRNSAVLPNNKR